jgi:primary-amine oxidase
VTICASFRSTCTNPAKSELASISAGNTLDRRAFIVVIDLAARRVLEALVSLHDETLFSCEERRGVQPGIIIEEFILCEKAVKADPRWRAALSRRGITEFDKAIVDPWSAGAYGDEHFPDRRLAQGLTWIRGSDADVGCQTRVSGWRSLRPPHSGRGSIPGRLRLNTD